MLYSEKLTSWLKEKKIYLKYSTYTNYCNVIHNHILPSLGSYQIDTLIPFYLIFFMVFSPKYSEKRLIYTMYFYSPDFLAPFWHRKILKKFSSTVAGFCSANFILHRQFQTVIIRTWVLP